MWNGFHEMYEASSEEARGSADFLSQWVLRNHVETQAVAIRRIADRSSNPKTIALGRLLDEIATHPHILGVSAAEATADADRLESAARKARRFANKVVAHLDHEHAAASRDVSLSDLNNAVDLAAELWRRWYLAVTGVGVWVQLPSLDWSNVLRLHLRNPMIDNAEFIASRLVFDLGLGHEDVEGLSSALEGSSDEWGAAIGPIWANEASRSLAEALFEMMATFDDDYKRRLIAALRWTGQLRNGEPAT
jgi:hypothetical protein